MKFLKIVLGVIGLIGLGVGGYFLGQTDASTPVLAAAGCAGAGGLLLGLGLGLPGRTSTSIERATQQRMAEKQQSEIQSRARAAAESNRIDQPSGGATRSGSGSDPVGE